MSLRLLLAAAALLAVAACAESATAPVKKASGVRNEDETADGTCRSGYHIATREDGGTECVATADDSSPPGGGPASQPADTAATLPPAGDTSATLPPPTAPSDAG